MSEPKYIVRKSAEFKRDYKLAKKRGLDLDLLKEIINKLQFGETLDKKHKDHALHGKYQNFRECHITPDWLLIYKIEENDLILLMQRTGSHSDLF